MTSQTQKRLQLSHAQWVRVDFHLHTCADKEFTYSSAEDDFIDNYIDALEEAHIRLGIITNHNKFALNEFKKLRKQAKQRGIGLLPGVELSVNDGANGIHTLVVFSDEWLVNGDYINQFLNVAFKGKVPAEYEQNNGRSVLSLTDTIKELESYEKDFFLVFAHVEASNGLWNELDGGRIGNLGKDESFRKYTLGFQKVRTYNDSKKGKVDRTKVKQWLQDWYPAEVEGSDPKSIKEIGQGEKCYVKLGELSISHLALFL